ncbi:MAG TPA: PAS domain-containing protein [Dongiaceae bacterium]
MTATWDISFLLDPQGKIEEARGKCLEILGEPARAMIGRSMMPFIAGADRAHFRRFLGQLGKENAVRRALLHLRTAAHGDRPFFMEVQNGWSASVHWILLTLPSDQTGPANTLAVIDAPLPMGTDDELMMMIELAAEQATVPLDLTVFEVGSLAKPADLDAQRPGTSGQLRRQVEKSLITNAYDGVVSQSAPGVYNLLHSAETNPDQIASEMRASALEIGVDEGQLGLRQRTVNLGLKPNRDKIKSAVAQVKVPIQDRSLPAGAVLVEQPTRSLWPLYFGIVCVVLVLIGILIGFILSQ